MTVVLSGTGTSTFSDPVATDRQGFYRAVRVGSQ